VLSVGDFVKRSQASAVAESVQGKMAQQRKMHEEFRRWKESLVSMITRGARIVQYRDGSYQFLLPSKLVKLVWQVTLKERVRLAVQEGKLPSDAIKSMREELTQAANQIAEAENKLKEGDDGV